MIGCITLLLHSVMDFKYVDVDETTKQSIVMIKLVFAKEANVHV